MTRILPSTSLLLALLFGASLTLGPAAVAQETASPEDSRAAAVRLHDLFGREWEWRLEQNPLTATDVGRHEYNDRLPSVSAEDRVRRTAETEAFLAQLDAIDRDALGTEDRVSYDIFRAQLEERVAESGFGAWQIPINADSGFHIGMSRMPNEVPLATVEDYESYIARLRAIPEFFGQHVDNMRRGLERGMTLPGVVLEGYEVTIASHVVDDPAESVFFEPFESFPTGVPESERERLRQAGRAAVMEGPVPAYRSFLTFFEDEYLPGCRETLGAYDAARRAGLLRLPGEEVHHPRHDAGGDPPDRPRRGGDRIYAEMEAVIERGRLRGELRGVPDLPAHRSPVLRRRPPRT